MAPSIDTLPLSENIAFKTHVDAISDSNSDLEPLQSEAPQREHLTVDGLLQSRAHRHPDSVVVSYPKHDIDFVDYTYRQLDIFAYRAGIHYQQFIPTRDSSKEVPTVVALLGPSNIEYIITLLALVKLGHTILFLSTRISQEAIDSLLQVSGASFLITDTKFSHVGDKAREHLPNLQSLPIASQTLFDFPIEHEASTRLDEALDPVQETNNTCWIIHSSGSTGLPKPIYQKQSAALANFAGNMNMRAFITLPLYHNHGICNFFRAIHSAKSLHIFSADLPLTSQHLCTVLSQHNFEIFYGVPYALKLLAETETGIRLLQELRMVMFGGSACPDELGNRLVENGVTLVSHYGATEVGQLMTSFRPAGDKAWNYVREHNSLKPFLKWIPQGSNLFECAVLEGWPAKVTSNQPDGSYRTKDLFEPHPTIPGAWKYIARKDDTIVLVNGEKFNPVLLEGKIRVSPLVAETVVFGAGRPYLGILIVPSSNTEDMSQEEIVEALWAEIESCNQLSEAYARITKNMIRVLPRGTQYPRTDKGSIIRQAFLKAFAKEIDDTYDRADSASANVRIMSDEELNEFLRTAILAIMAKNVELQNGTDLFALGMDSLQAIQLRGEILRNVNMGSRKLGDNVVFDHPSIDKLCRYLSSDLAHKGEEAIDVKSQMQGLIDVYSQLPPIITPPRTSVVVTGATGSLGAHVVAEIARDQSIDAVYCLVRAADDSEAMARVRDSLIQRRIYHCFPREARGKIIALSFNQSEPQLGLESSRYHAIASKLRSVIHCAWAVNFNWSLSSFEPSCIAGISHLLNLCRAAHESSPASFNFCSSVSTTAAASLQTIPETRPDLEWAQNMGYAQSKNLTENLCLEVAERYNIPARILRVGQIIADTQQGVWNSTEAIPLQLQSAITIGALPALPENPSWLPVDTVARGVVDISLSDANADVFNVVNHQTFSWTDHLLPALRNAGLQFQVVTPKAWVQRLRESNPDPIENPPIKLLDFFASKYDRDDAELGRSKRYDSEKARGLSPTLASAPVINNESVAKFVQYFQSSAWATTTTSLSSQERQPQKKVVIFVAGPCGSGKSTIGSKLATHLQGAFIEGDSLHTQEAVEKMSKGEHLQDSDRWAWLDRIVARVAQTTGDLGYGSVVVSCSALKRSYRDKLRRLADDRQHAVVIVDLQISSDVLQRRVEERKGHYMRSEMVQGQFKSHEAIQSDEMDVIPVDAGDQIEQVLEDVKEGVATMLRGNL